MKSSILAGALALALAGSSALAAEVPLKQPGRWAQDYTGRKADPTIRFGTLPNGLRYAIRHNETPKDGVAMRMRIGAGSIVEREDEQGLAHFLEHMAFRGSKNVADGEVVHMLERQGLRFGPDTNAFTAQDETVYTFTFPRTDPAAIDTGLTLFREIGERLNLSPEAVEAEKGVVLSEERVGDVPAYRAAKANFGNSLAGVRAVSRWPIGQVEAIKAATPERLRRYYQANYRPDNATLIVVGNVDPATVEAEIKARFSDWKPAGRPDPLNLGAPSPAAPAAEFVAGGAQDMLTLAWVRPADARAETEAVDRETLARLLGLVVLNNRLADRAAKPGSPYLRGSAGMQPSLFGSAELTELAIIAAPERWREALEAVTEEQRRLLSDGVQAAELQRAKTQILTLFQAQAASADTRNSGAIADQLVRTVNQDQLPTSPAQDLALTQAALPGMGVDEINAGLRQAFGGRGPVLFRAAQAGPVGPAVLSQALTADLSRPLSARAAEAAVEWPYSSFGAPSRVISQSENRPLGATVVTFANGARLIVKPTPFEKDRVEVSVAIGEGRAGAPPAQAHALWAVEATPLGGTAKLSAGEITRWAQTSGKVVGAQMGAGVGAFTLSGVTRPRDLASELQILAAFARDPGFRPELAEQLKARAPMIAGQYEANAAAVFVRELQRLAAGGDPRFAAVPSRSDLETTTVGDLQALLRGPLAGPADVVIVGDVTVDDAIKATQATFGAGPAAPRTPLPRQRAALPPGRAEPYVVQHHGRADQAYYGEYWRLPDYFADPKTARVADVAAAILQSRLIDTVREKLGLTYSPQVSALSSVELSGQGYIGAAIETPPANFATFHTLLASQLAELAARPVSEDELKRAKTPLIEARTKDLEHNAYWLRQLRLFLRDPRIQEEALGQADGFRSITAEDVQRLLKVFVVGKPAVTVIAKAAS